ncbi:MAG: methylmalonyl Co-A mutase-associated GTPase MeaB [SAR202 cluster bacterium]|nr:methylmalonyl Co-A mutase-associated GTPase MeaB [SAR202 cluster bacterium]
MAPLSQSTDKLTTQMLSGNRRALAQMLSALEREPESIPAIMQAVHSRTGRAYCVGLTGAPGAGKSTLLHGMIDELRRREKTVGVLAVDPSSRATGGAVLGDRVRMKGHHDDEGVFIRSLATKGVHGGLSRVARASVRILDAFGFDVVLVETVGVGQTEMDVIKIADTVVVVLVPEGGDAVQVMKAGLVEVGDVFVVNKADRQGADRMLQAVEVELKAHEHGGWKPPVLLTEAYRKVGVPKLVDKIEQHRAAMEASQELEARRARHRHDEMLDAIRAALESALSGLALSGDETAAITGRVERGEIDPYTAAAEVLGSGDVETWLAETLRRILRREGMQP